MTCSMLLRTRALGERWAIGEIFIVEDAGLRANRMVMWVRQTPLLVTDEESRTRIRHRSQQ